ncbi:hypothetical protein HPP92_028600 [Vanilla planifolia]|uniref:Glucose-6-phosphate dehydrogenase C-terminal domain-containing protein n=1 Tax=Vanilla planifolia TaxID=51239 RepID=A0A835P4U5_VANPL|nr:hypothetical protein HPP92_028600 [Vanilla planifolia]
MVDEMGFESDQQRLEYNSGMFLGTYTRGGANHPLYDTHALGLTIPVTGKDQYFDQLLYSKEIPDAYERLLLDAIEGERRLFIRSDELDAAWKLFTPLLKELEESKIAPELYPYGGRGPLGAHYLAAKHNVRTACLSSCSRAYSIISLSSDLNPKVPFQRKDVEGRVLAYRKAAANSANFLSNVCIPLVVSFSEYLACRVSGQDFIIFFGFIVGYDMVR